EDLKDEFRFKDDYKIEILYGLKLAEALNVSEVGPFKFNNKEYVKSMFYALRKVLYSVYYIDEDFSFSLEAILSKAGFNDSEILNFVQVKHTSNFDLSFVSLVVNTVRTYKYLVEDISDYRSINEEKILSKKIKLAFSENPSQTEMYT
ncbi:MAG: hypothetical protein PF795_14200, partial [Kiritimatiellae bacterium]|nr:hypothetical protein [Kiritimatiellia bacterium]